MNTALVTDIKRFAVHDGDGIRTTVFFKGCPLQCVWCHNPEGIAPQRQLAYFEHKCIGCGMCSEICPNEAHIIRSGTHIVEREKCVACGQCETVCLGDALKIYGKAYTTEELLRILVEDKEFYDNSNGGVTVSGGECLLHADFCRELLAKLKKENIHTAVDTCGFVPREALDKVMPYTDVFLYDIKAFDEEVHIRCTGQSNRVILENLKYLEACGKTIEIRIPYVPEYNAAQIDKIFAFLKSFRHIVKIRVLAYHHYAASKYAALSMNCTLPERMPLAQEVAALQKQADLICGAG